MKEMAMFSVSGLDPVCLVFGYPQKILQETQSLQRPFFFFKFCLLSDKGKNICCARPVFSLILESEKQTVVRSG